MTKLDEIEARAKVIPFPSNPTASRLQMDNRLLIRAVRQLAAARDYAVHDEACAIDGIGRDDIDAEFCTCGYIEAFAITADVLELIP